MSRRKLYNWSIMPKQQCTFRSPRFIQNCTVCQAFINNKCTSTIVQFVISVLITCVHHFNPVPATVCHVCINSKCMVCHINSFSLCQSCLDHSCIVCQICINISVSVRLVNPVPAIVVRFANPVSTTTVQFVKCISITNVQSVPQLLCTWSILFQAQMYSLSSLCQLNNKCTVCEHCPSNSCALCQSCFKQSYTVCQVCVNLITIIQFL